uniref:Serpentine receptor class gamma n=1 Tax=Strongyloides venezuelensis TaxID=75913 RepID=A0A0K0F0J4_STRVS
MIPTIYIFQLIYSIPSIIFYVIFIFKLGYQIFFIPKSYFNNEYYPIIFYKGINDIVLLCNVYTTLLPPRWGILNNFYLDNQYLAIICYFITGVCYTISFFISSLLSFNIYIALCHPFNYSKWFKKRNVFIFLISIFIIGCLFGGVTVNAHPYYQKLQGFFGLSISFSKRRIGFSVLLYTLLIILPLALISLILNIFAIKKFTQQIHANNINSRKKNELILYGIFSLILSLLCSGCFIARSVNFLTSKKITVEIMAERVTPFIFDAQTLGLFGLNLFISQPLRKMMFGMVRIKSKPRIYPTPP